jgi:hypothetical protein
MIAGQILQKQADHEAAAAVGEDKPWQKKRDKKGGVGG